MVAGVFRFPKATSPYRVGPKSLRVNLWHSPVWPFIEPARADLMLAAGRLLGAGATVQELILPEPFNQLRDAHTDSNRGALVVPAGIPVGVRDPRPRPAG